MTYRDITINTTVDKNLDAMGYKVWIPQTVSGSVLSEVVTIGEKNAPHFKTEEEARKYIDYCLDPGSDATGAGTYSNANVADTA